MGHVTGDVFPLPCTHFICQVVCPSQLIVSELSFHGRLTHICIWHTRLAFLSPRGAHLDLKWIFVSTRMQFNINDVPRDVSPVMYVRCQCLLCVSASTKCAQRMHMEPNSRMLNLWSAWSVQTCTTEEKQSSLECLMREQHHLFDYCEPLFSLLFVCSKISGHLWFHTVSSFSS